MKKIIHKILIVSFVSMLIFPLGTKAQEAEFGVKGGLNLSLLTLDDANDNNLLPGFHAGLALELPITTSFSLQPEVMYSLQGVKTTYDTDFLGIDVANGETDFKLHYINVPLFFKYNLAEDFNIHVGPYIGFLTKAVVETDTEILDFVDVDDAEQIDRDRFNKVDAGATFGLGFELAPIVLGFDYNIGFIQVAEEDDIAEDLLGDAKNQVIQVYIGFVF